MVSFDEYESLMETIEVTGEMPELDKDIKEAREAYKSGEYKTWTTLEGLLAKQGFVLAEKAKKQYGVSSKAQSKRRKTIK